MALTLTDEEKQTLLADARETIAARLEQRKPSYRRSPELAAAIADGRSALSLPCGAFVTLHSVDGKSGGPHAGGRQLRGCIGRMNAVDALEKTVQLMAVEAAFGDPRFYPLTKEQLPGCEIEISVLSPMEICTDPRSVKVGVHGLHLTYHGRAGVLLPQVPVEQGWDLNQYLDYICTKAGVPPKSFEAPDAELRTFTAVVFGEN